MVFTNDKDGFKFFGRTADQISRRYDNNRKNGRNVVVSAGSALWGQSYQITEDDIGVINNYNKALEKGAIEQAKLDEILKGSSKETATYIRGLDGLKASTDGLAQSAKAAGLSARVASLGMKALSIAGSMLATMLISMAFQAAITGLDNLAHASERAKEALDDFNQKVKEGRDKLKEKYEFINSDEAKKLDELSHGIDGFGKNISLTTEQFNEYHSITNKVAEMFPAMVKGWDNQGNAILNNVDVLKQLNDEYKKAQDNHYSEIIEKSGDTQKEYNTYTKGALWGMMVGKEDEIEAIEQYIEDGFKLNPNRSADNQGALINMLKSLGIGADELHDLSDDISKQQRVVTQLQKLRNEQNAAFAPMKELLEAHAYTSKQGRNFTEKQSNIIDNFVNSFTYENSEGKTADELINEVNTFITQLAGNSDLSIDLAKLIKIDSNSVPEADFQKMWNDMLKRLEDAGFDPEIIAQIKLAFDVKDVDSEERKNAIKDKIAKMLIPDGSNMSAAADGKGRGMFVDVEKARDEVVARLQQDLSKPELDFALNPENGLKFGQKTYEEIVKYIKEEFNKKPVEVEPEVKLKAKFESVDGMSDAFKSLKTAMDQITDDGKVAFSTIQTLNEKLGEDIVEKYANTLMDASSSAEELSNAITGMTQDYIDARIAAGELNDADENMIASMLDEAGIANAVEVAHDNVAEARVKAALAAFDNAVASGDSADEAYEDAKALIEEADNGEIAAWALDRLAYAKERANAINIDAATDVSQLKWLISVANETTAALNRVQITKGAISIGSVVDDIAGDAKSITLPEFVIPKTTPTFKPSDKKDKSKDAADKVKDINKQLDDLGKSEALQKLKYQFDQLEEPINKITDSLNLLKTTLDLQAEDDYIGKLETVGYQIDLTNQKTALLIDEFNQLKNTKPVTADMANEIANRMKTVTESIATNRKEMIDYARNVTEYYMSAMKSVGSMQKDMLSKATSLFERNVKTLKEGGLSGLRFSITPTVPQSAYDKQRKENQELRDEMQSYYDTLANMQKTALDMQYQEQLADNARKRQELYQSLEDAKAELSKSVGEMNDTVSKGAAKSEQTQKETNAKTSAEQKRDDAEKKAEAEKFSFEMQTVVNDLNTWMEQNPIKAPKLDTSSWENMVSMAEDYAERIQNAFTNAASVHFEHGDFGQGREALIAAARSQIGYREGANNTNKFSSYFGKGAQAWCNDFVSWAVEQAGLGDEIPEGSYTVDTAKRFKAKGKLFPASEYTPIPGDIAYFSTGGIDGIHHVEIVTEVDSDGSVKTIGGNTGRNGEVAERVRKDKPSFYGTYAKGTDTFPVVGNKPNGVVGENYKKETIINQRTGETSIVDSPTLIDTNEYDIIGEKQTAEMLKNQYANGTFDNWNNLSLKGGLPHLTVEQIQAILSGTSFKNSPIAGSAQGIYNAQQKTGISALYTLATAAFEGGWAKSKVSYGKNNYWGWNHYPSGGMSAYDHATTFSSNVGEAFTDYSTRLSKIYGSSSVNSMAKKYSGEGDGGGWARGVSSVLNQFSKLLQNKGLTNFASASDAIVENTGETAKNTASTVTAVREVRQGFKTQLQNFLNGNQPSESSTNKWEDDLMSYIKENVERSSKSNERLVEKFDKMEQYQEHGTEVFKELGQKLTESVGTDEFRAVGAEINNAAQDYILTMMNMQSDITTAQYEEAYTLAEDTVSKIRGYYNKRKAEGADADELITILKSFDEAQEIVDGLSDDYVSQMSKQTEVMMAAAERKTKAYDDENSWLVKNNEELDRQIERTEDAAAKVDLMAEKAQNYSRQIENAMTKQAQAHQNVLDLYNDDRYKEVFERYDIESWFDAEGNLSSKFEEDVQSQLLANPKLVPMMNQLAEFISAQKKAWYDSEKLIEDTYDAQRNMNKEMAQLRVDKWVEYKERLIEVRNYQKELNDAIVDGKQQMYDFRDTLRDEELAITTELRKTLSSLSYLDKDERLQMFNEDDYKAEIKVIRELNDEMTRLYNDYQDDISSLSEEEAWKAELITAEYNRQVDALKDKLDLTKKQLAERKAEIALENGRKERDTQVIMGNRSVNIADPERIAGLVETLTQTEGELSNAELHSNEAGDIRNMQRVSDEFGAEIAQMQAAIDMVNKMGDAEREAFADLIENIDVLSAKIESMHYPDSWYLVNEDIADGVYTDLPIDKMHGFNLSHDYQADLNMIRDAYESGLLDYDKAIERLDFLDRRIHSNKTLVDPHNTGYQVYGEAVDYPRLSRGLMSLMSPTFGEEYRKREAERTVDIAAQADLTNSYVNEYEKLPTVSGEGGFIIDGEVYRIMDDVANAFTPMDISTAALGGYQMYQGDIAKLVRDNLGNSNVDNSIHIDNVNLTETHKNVSSILNEVNDIIGRLNGITNNMR